MKPLWTLLGFLVVTAVSLSILFAAPPSLAAGEEGGEADGKAVFLAQKCNLCHAVVAAEIAAKTQSDKLKGPDLGGFAPEAEFAAVASYVRKQGELDGKQHKREYKGTDEELQTILDWLKEQEKAAE